MSGIEKNNLQQLYQSAHKNQKSLFKLLQIGRKQGFDNFINRKLIWPFLLELDSQKLKQAPVFQWKVQMNKSSYDFQQLQKDAQRSLSTMKTFQSITKFHLKKKQQAVLTVLDNFFIKNPQLKYIQGFHDVASIFLIIFGNSLGYYLMQRAGRTYFYDFLTFQFGQVGQIISQIVYQIVTSLDPEFKSIYSYYENTKFLIFILPWILTWFSHNFTSVKIICRIWDYLLCTGPHGIFYLTAGIILSTKAQLLKSCDELDEPSIQTFYQQQAKHSNIDIQLGIKTAMQIQQKINIQELPGFQRLNPNSMIRTEVFYKVITVHKKYQQLKKKQMKRNLNIKKVAVIVAVTAVAIIVGTIYLRNFGKLKILSQL